MKLACLSALALSACTSLAPTTVMRLGNLSPLTADPADFAVDLTLPSGIDVSPGKAILIFSVRRTDIERSEEGFFTLQRTGSVFAIDPADYADLRALQALALDWQDENPDASSGALSVALSPCRIDEGPADDAKVSVAIQVAQGGAFLPLVRNGPLSAVTSDEQLQNMPDCPQR